MRIGFTFQVIAGELGFTLARGTIWQLTELPIANAEVPKYKSTAKFARLRLDKHHGIRITSKSIRLSEEAINKYITNKYIKNFWEASPND